MSDSTNGDKYPECKTLFNILNRSRDDVNKYKGFMEQYCDKQDGKSHKLCSKSRLYYADHVQNYRFHNDQYRKCVRKHYL